LVGYCRDADLQGLKAVFKLVLQEPSSIFCHPSKFDFEVVNF